MAKSVSVRRVFAVVCNIYMKKNHCLFHTGLIANRKTDIHWIFLMTLMGLEVSFSYLKRKRTKKINPLVPNVNAALKSF